MIMKKQTNNIILDKDDAHEMCIAQEIRNKHLIYTIKEWDAAYDPTSFTIYKNGVFIGGKEAGSLIREWITEMAENIKIEYIDSKGKSYHKPYRLSPSKRSEIMEQIKTRTFISYVEFDTECNRLNCKNGHVHIEGNGEVTFAEHYTFDQNPYKTFFQIPWDYDPSAECLKTDQALCDIFGFDRVPLIYEMLAYCCMPYIKYEKAFLLYGPPNSGKTTFIEGILMTLIGGPDERHWIDNASQIELQALGERFGLGRLKDKRINYFDDLSNKSLREVAMKYFRILVTNRFLAGELKHVNGQAGWKNIIKLLFTCNILPELKKDPGEQFWRRWILLHCYNEFKEKDKFTQEDENDPNIFEKKFTLREEIAIDAEMSGLINKILEGWKRLDARGGFPNEWDDTEKIKKLWMFDINPVSEFVKECCELKSSYEVDYGIFYKELNSYRMENGAKPISKHMMTQKMSLLNIEGWNENKKIDKKYHENSSGRNYVGIRIKKTNLKTNNSSDNGESRSFDDFLINPAEDIDDNVDFSDIKKD